MPSGRAQCAPTIIRECGCNRIPRRTRTNSAPLRFWREHVTQFTARIRLRERPVWMAPALQEVFATLRWSVSTVVCPACLRGGLPLALMSSAGEVPIG